MASPITDDYSSITELPGSHATREQLARLYHRYHMAAQYTLNKRILEVACGAGLGLGYLALKAKSIIGGDYTANLLDIAQSHYRGNIPLFRLDAHYLPFRDRSFDLVIIFEAIYYLPNAQQFFAEARRVLSENGIFIIGTVNKDWGEFASSPFSTRYFSIPELRDLLTQEGFTNLEFYGSFPTEAASPRQRIVSLIRRLVVALNLIPKTLEARARFKRLFYGSLTPLPPEVTDGMASLYPLEPTVPDTPNKDYKIIYCIAIRP